MENWKMLMGVIVGTLVLVFGVAMLFSTEPAPTKFESSLAEGEATHVRLAVSEASGSGELSSEGASEAGEESGELITVVEFSDFQCPACKAAQPMVERLIVKGNGRVRLVYRHFPLDQIHPNARMAAAASEVMADKGLFWEYHDMLFEKQEEWADLKDPKDTFADYASELGVEREEFLESLSDSQYRDRVQGDFVAANAMGLQGTPSFIVDGELVNSSYVEAFIGEKLNTE